jgi:hypothetical protein
MSKMEQNGNSCAASDSCPDLWVGVLRSSFSLSVKKGIQRWAGVFGNREVPLDAYLCRGDGKIVFPLPASGIDP